MKAAVAGLVLVGAVAPAFSQIADVEIDALMKRWVVGFNRGDAAGLANDVYANPDESRLNAKFHELRADSFGKLDVYDFKACPTVGGKTRVLMTFARLYTFGGKMNDDEAKLFDLVQTPVGWRVAAEADASFDAELSC